MNDWKKYFEPQRAMTPGDREETKNHIISLVNSEFGSQYLALQRMSQLIDLDTCVYVIAKNFVPARAFIHDFIHIFSRIHNKNVRSPTYVGRSEVLHGLENATVICIGDYYCHPEWLRIEAILSTRRNIDFWSIPSWRF